MNKSAVLRKAGQFSCAYDKNGYIGVLTLAGDLTKGSLKEITTQLTNSMKDADFVVVNLDAVIGADNDFFSLFCMAARTAQKENKRLYLGRATSEQQIAASQVCSSDFSKAAQQDCALHCFWMHRSSGDGMESTH